MLGFGAYSDRQSARKHRLHSHGARNGRLCGARGKVGATGSPVFGELLRAEDFAV